MRYLVLAAVLISAIMLKADASECGDVASIISNAQRRGFNQYQHNSELESFAANYLQAVQEKLEPQKAFITEDEETGYQLAYVDGGNPYMINFKLKDSSLAGCIAGNVYLPQFNEKAEDIIIRTVEGSLIVEIKYNNLVLIPR